MSFLKISDPVKRDLIVNEYLEIQKNIRDNLLTDRTGEQQLQTDLSKFFKPITEAQKATTTEITVGHKPIKEGIDNLPQAITFPAYPSVQAIEEAPVGEGAPYLGDIAKTYSRKFTTKDDVDRTYGLYDKDGKFYIGNKLAIIVDKDLVVGRDEYKGTPGLWQLIVSKHPDNTIYNDNDKYHYARLILKTNALCRGNDPESNRPKSSKAPKWNNIHSEIWQNRKKFEGKGVVVIPSDPNASHTGVGNELVSICDELKRKGVLDTRSYEKLNSIFKK